MATLVEWLSLSRIAVTRIFALGFFIVLLLTESTLDQYLIGEILFLFGLVLVGLGVCGRLWCSLYISGHKNTALITQGPYSITRNPLYFFSFLGFLGIACATEILTFVAIAVIGFAIFYPGVIRNEEKFLKQKFGSAYEEYCANTPRFFQDFKKFHEPETYVVNTRLFVRSMWDAMWFVWLVGIIEVVEALHEKHVVAPLIHLP